MNEGESLSLVEIAGTILTDTVVPIVVIACFITIFVVLKRAFRIRTTKELSYLLYSIGSFAFSLAVPFLAFPILAIFELSENRIANSIFLLICAGAIVSGTYFLVNGARQLRAEADAA